MHVVDVQRTATGSGFDVDAGFDVGADVVGEGRVAGAETALDSVGVLVGDAAAFDALDVFGHKVRDELRGWKGEGRGVGVGGTDQSHGCVDGG